jgi:uncharacterized membrane protein
MEHECHITGNKVEETEGVFWQQIRPSVQDFLQTIKPDWKDGSFISYRALNDLMRIYMLNRAEEEKKAQKVLRKLDKAYTEEDARKALNFENEEKLPSFGERMADKIAEFGGSWKFIGIFVGFMAVWITANAWFLKNRNIDPYPFILLNLMLSCLAALQAPIIMMSQNRQEDKDRAHAEYDFRVNLKAEAEIRNLHEKLDHLLTHQHENMNELFQLNVDMMQMMQQRIDALSHSAKEPKTNV